MLDFALVVIMILMLAVIFMFITKKNISYRIQASSAFNSLIVIFIALYFYKIGKPEYLDIAILYALLSYVSILAITKYLVYRIEDKDL